MSTGIIKINRGDSFEFPLTVTDNCGKAHLLTADEVVYFALLYPNQHFEDAILVKGYTSEEQNVDTAELIIKLTPNDTRTLAPGVYYYTLKYQRGGTLEVINDLDDAEEVRTLVERTKFIIYD